MTKTQPSLLARHDTVLGVCQGIGEDLGVHPNLLRIAFGMAIFFAPLAAIVTYVALGLVVAATHYAFPFPPVAPAAAALAPVELAPAIEADDEQVSLAA